MDTALRTTRYTDVGMCVLLPVTLVAGTLVGGCAVTIQTASRTSRNTPAISNEIANIQLMKRKI
jgi:hypothetical protein